LSKRACCCRKVGGSRLGGLFFQGEVHALMATIL
jgi:hypothetical protein